MKGLGLQRVGIEAEAASEDKASTAKGHQQGSNKDQVQPAPCKRQRQSALILLPTGPWTGVVSILEVFVVTDHSYCYCETMARLCMTTGVHPQLNSVVIQAVSVMCIRDILRMLVGSGLSCELSTLYI